MTDKSVKFDMHGDTALKAQIEIAAPPEKVYSAWTTRELFVKWFGPRSGGSLQVDQFDCSVGGRYDVSMLFADGDRVKLAGEYQELDPPKRIVFTWQWTEGATVSNETLVTVDLARSDVGTVLTLTHERFLAADARNNHSEGWGPLLERLATQLE